MFIVSWCINTIICYVHDRIMEDFNNTNEAIYKYDGLKKLYKIKIILLLYY